MIDLRSPFAQAVGALLVVCEASTHQRRDALLAEPAAQSSIHLHAVLLMSCCSAQVCGVFLLFISGTHTLMYWGLYCYPWLRDGFIVAYYLAALGCVLGGLRAKTQMQRALPMLALFGVRFLCLGARMVLNSGSQSACIHYATMEVSLELCLRTWFLV